MDHTDGAPVEDAMADVPELKSYMTDDDEEKVTAMKLVADSVAQMRQGANRALIFHPLNMAVAIAVASLIARFMINRKHDVITVATTCSGLLMVCLALCRFATQGYIVAAEAINWEWLGNADVIVTKFGDELIGTVIIDWLSGESRQRRKKAWRGEIKGWAVRLKYRGKGVGTALLEDAVKEFRKRGAETIEFAEDHASKFGTDYLIIAYPDSAVQTRNESFLHSITDSLTGVRRDHASCCKIFLKPVRRKASGKEAVVREFNISLS